MRIVVALGGNALLQRGQPMTAEQQRENVRVAASQLAPVAQDGVAHVADAEPVHEHHPGPDLPGPAGLAAVQLDHVAVLADEDALARDAG